MKKLVEPNEAKKLVLRANPEGSPLSESSNKEVLFTGEEDNLAQNKMSKAIPKRTRKVAAEAPMKTIIKKTTKAAAEVPAQAVSKRTRKSAIEVPAKVAKKRTEKVVADAPVQAVPKRTRKSAIEVPAKVPKKRTEKVAEDAPVQAVPKRTKKEATEIPVKALARRSTKTVEAVQVQAAPKRTRKASTEVPVKAAVKLTQKAIEEETSLKTTPKRTRKIATEVLGQEQTKKTTKTTKKILPQEVPLSQPVAPNLTLATAPIPTLAKTLLARTMAKLFTKAPAKKTLQNKEDILLRNYPDRRVLSKVPDKDGVRTNFDRRKINSNIDTNDLSAIIVNESMGRRYAVDYNVTIQYNSADLSLKNNGKSVNISTTGMLLEVSPDVAQDLRQATTIKLNFVIEPGTMPEGYEMTVNIKAKYIRASENTEGKILCGLEFSETLAQYATKRKNVYMLSIASLFLFLIVACVFLMRAESVLYFKFNKILYTYSIIAATFLLTRYLFGSFYRPVPIDKDFTPGVTIVIPCFNEEEWIKRTILGCINQDYPIDKLEVIVVDDCSNDQSFAKIEEVVEELRSHGERYEIGERLQCVRQAENAGKREAMSRGALMAKHELLVFVDSDSFLDPFAIRNLVQPFKDTKMAGVSGRTDVANTYTNALTKMQAVRYFIAFRIMKAAESYFDAVTCLSGPLSCYRKDLVLEYLEAWRNQSFFGEKATFGDDRSLTNFMLRNYRTAYQDTATCSTVVPNTYNVFLKQQMRWKRSWLRESLIASRFMWKKEPFMAMSFYMGVLVPIVAPIIVLYNFIYIPLAHRVFPFTFMIGIFLMAFLMSVAQLFLRKSSTWIFGLWFCAYYEAVLLWQMPIAWFTFGKTTWGTRLTPADLMKGSKVESGKVTRA